jgi:hypothetical protein
MSNLLRFFSSRSFLASSSSSMSNNPGGLLSSIEKATLVEKLRETE